MCILLFYLIESLLLLFASSFHYTKISYSISKIWNKELFWNLKQWKCFGAADPRFRCFSHFTFFLHIIGTSTTRILQMSTKGLSICKFAKTMTERDCSLTTIYKSEFFGNSKIFVYNLCTTVFFGSRSFGPELWLYGYSWCKQQPNLLVPL